MPIRPWTQGIGIKSKPCRRQPNRRDRLVGGNKAGKAMRDATANTIHRSAGVVQRNSSLPAACSIAARPVTRRALVLMTGNVMNDRRANR